MQSLPFTLRQLEVFSALCATHSFRLTADRLRISQASVSNQVKTLEEQLGVKLFHRVSGKRPMLTAEGLAFLTDLDAFDAAGRALAAHRKLGDRADERTYFRIRIGETIMDRYVRPKFDRFLIDNPDIVLEFDTQPPSNKTGADVEKAGFDFALVHLRDDYPLDPIFRKIALLSGGIYGHRRFAEAHKLPLQPDYLSDLPFILPRAGSEQEREVYLALRRVGITPRKIISHTPYFDVIASMLGQGLGVASFAEVVLPPSLREAVILLYPLNNWRLSFYRRDSGKDQKVDRVEEFLLTSLLTDPDYPTLTIFDSAYA
jgi:DNA-binding transcriptional LysR family regulator